MAIVEASQKIPATVAALSKVQENEYGEYRSVLFEGQGLEGGKLWRKFPPEQAARFSRGDRVNLTPTTRKGKPAWDVELLSSSAPAAAATTPPAADQLAAAKQAIAQDVKEMANLYGFCYGEAKRVLEPHGATTEGIQGCAFRLWHHAKDQMR
jgi:hypothetical protein